MSGYARHVAPLRPTTVAVHDDRDVFGETSWIETAVNFVFLTIKAREYFVVQSDPSIMRLSQVVRVGNAG
jgi:hypothetical protein